MTRPIICAHRGLSAEHPENTISAFRAAMEAGFDAIELDVRLTHDGVPVVMHDENIARTTDGVGRVSDFDFAELRTHETADGPIPTLQEALAAGQDWDGIWNVEVKDAAAAKSVAQEMGVAELGERGWITAMDPAALAEPALGATPRGLITMGPPDLHDWAEAESTSCAWLMSDYEYVTPGLVDVAQESGIKLGAWTVNDPIDATRLAGLGVQMIITDTRAVLEVLR